jgi:hypothetical protein
MVRISVPDINLLESGQRVIEDGDRSFDDGAITEGFDVAGVNDVRSLVRFRSLSAAYDALAVDGPLLWRTGSHSVSVVHQQVLGIRFHASSVV